MKARERNPIFTTKTPIVDLSFGSGGNSKILQVSGWAEPEESFTWSVGRVSELCLTCPEDTGDLILMLEGQPFLHPPTLKSQRIAVILNGKQVALLREFKAFRRAIRIQVSPTKADCLSLQISCPDARSPEDFGSSDSRILGVAWYRVALFSIASLRRSYYDRGLFKNDTFKAGSSFPRPNSTSNNFQRLLGALLSGLEENELKISQSYLNDVFDLNCRIAYTSEFAGDITLVRCTINTQGHMLFQFSSDWLSPGTRPAGYRMLASRWLAILPLFKAYVDTGRSAGSVILSLGDEEHARGVSFASQSSHSIIIPDPYFLMTRGYEDLRQLYNKHAKPFSARKREALWRGSSTGGREGQAILDRDRVKLCLFCRENEALAPVNVGLTQFVQVGSADLRRLESLGLLREEVPPEQFAEWQIHIDIDGNTNSWSGLFQKLLSGALVLKIESRMGWRGWYDDRLEPYVNYIPVASDYSDLLQKVKYYAYNQAEAEKVAAEGRSLALSLQYITEVDGALTSIEDAIIQENTGGFRNRFIT